MAWQAHADFPFVLAANRDEFFARRSASADFWIDHPQVLAGRDHEAGGTWLGMTRSGRFAALTNFRAPGSHKPQAPSRGKLVADYLSGDMSIDAYLDTLNPADYNGFNLLLGTVAGENRRLVAFSNISNERHLLAPGVYGLSNQLLDTPWPKVGADGTASERAVTRLSAEANIGAADVKPRERRLEPKVGAGKTALAAALTALPDENPLLKLLRDDTIYPDQVLPATGVSLAWERLLSAAFIRGADYGTRCSTVMKVGADGTATFDEQSWLPDGQAGARRRFRFRLTAQ